MYIYRYILHCYVKHVVKMDDCEVFIISNNDRAFNGIPGLPLVYQSVALFVNNLSSSSYYDKSSGHFACKLSRIKCIIIFVQNTLWSSVIILYS